MAKPHPDFMFFQDKTARAFDVASGKELHTFTGHTGSVTCLQTDKEPGFNIIFDQMLKMMALG